MLPPRAVTALALLLSATRFAHAQSSPPGTLTLGAALDQASSNAFGVRAARAQVQVQQSQATATLRGILPSLRIDAGIVRTTDPIGAFGNSLRQRSITSADFDPAHLNYPGVSQNWLGGLVLEQPLLNLDALTARRAARLTTRSAQSSADWSAIETRANIVRAYYGVILAAAKVATLQNAVAAAREHVRQAEAMAKNGIVTPSDALLASVKAGEVESSLLEADGELTSARLALAVTLGAQPDTSRILPSTLPEVSAVRAAANSALELSAIDRADVTAARDMGSAFDADRWRARALSLPRINAIARYDWNSPSRAFGGDKNWTVGVMASWSIASGAADIAERQASAGRARAADAMRDGAEARARLEEGQTAAALTAALARLTIAERSVRQSADAHRIVGRRYDGGLASVMDLLDAAALETQSRLGFAAARYVTIVATADRLKALGRDPGLLRSLDSAPALTDNSSPN